MPKIKIILDVNIFVNIHVMLSICEVNNNLDNNFNKVPDLFTYFPYLL
jgi:hypothetical protein